MKYQVGDTVLIQAKIVFVDEIDKEVLIEVANPYGGKKWVRFADVFELPKPDKTYEQGLEDAWALAKNYEKMSMAERKRIFGVDAIWEILNIFTPQEALAKLKGYEEVRVNVGDVVKYDGIQAVVMDIDTVGNVALFTENACIESWIPKCLVKKTSKNIDVESLLEQIKGDANE